MIAPQTMSPVAVNPSRQPGLVLPLRVRVCYLGRGPCRRHQFGGTEARCQRVDPSSSDLLWIVERM